MYGTTTPKDIQGSQPQDIPHYDSDSGNWDGQLANPDIAQIAGPARPTPSTARPTPTPEMETWAEWQGPNLPMGPRVLLRELVRYASRDTGRCWPAQETLADSLECSSRSVRTWTELLKIGGFLTTATIVDPVGKKHLTYTMAGAACGWEITRKRNRGGQSLIKSHLTEINRLQTQLDAALAMLGIDNTYLANPPEAEFSGKQERESLSENSAISETHLSPRYPENPEADQPEADQPEADQPEADQPEADQPEADQPEAEISGRTEPESELAAIRRKVVENWPTLKAKGWDYQGAAVKQYQQFGMAALDLDIEEGQEKERAARTCVHCDTVHDSTADLQVCGECGGSWCTKTSNPFCSRWQNSCRRQRNGQRPKGLRERMLDAENSNPIRSTTRV